MSTILGGNTAGDDRNTHCNWKHVLKINCDSPAQSLGLFSFFSTRSLNCRHGTPDGPSTKCSILAVVESFSPLYYLLFNCICTTIIIFLVWTRAFISSNEMQYQHCSLNIWHIVSCPMLIRRIGKHFMLGLSIGMYLYLDSAR